MMTEPRLPPPKFLKPHSFVLDVDGVMTNGQFYYTEAGKIMKIFGPHDNDGLRLLKDKLQILFITADKRGFDISRKRIVEDMGYELKLVSEQERYSFFEQEVGFDKSVFMGDGYFDAPILKKCSCGIAPISARQEAKDAADYITPSAAGSGAVMDACLYILEEYFGS